MSAEDFKDQGNAALKAGKISDAIDFYTKAINLDGANHVYFSNRSAAYLQKGDAHNALEDANSCIGLAGDSFAKGYSRKGAALHALKRYNDAISAYQEGLQKFPGEASLEKGLEQVKRDKDGPPMGAFSGGAAGGARDLGLFGPQMMAEMAMNPKLRPFLNDPEVMDKIKACQANPNAVGAYLQDPKFMEFFEALLGGKLGTVGGDVDGDDDKEPPRRYGTAPPNPNSKPSEPEPMETEQEEDWSQLSPEERRVKEDRKAANKKKDEGNDYYKAKKYDEALECYDAAILLDPTNMTFVNNKAAVYFSRKKYQECIEECLKAVEIGKEHRASFQDRAKALTRVAKAYQKLGDLAKAIEYCQLSQLESFDKDTQRLLKTLELEKKKQDTLAYQDDGKAEEAKQRGNNLFREQKYGEAIHEYEEAVKRAPKNSSIRNNLAAALCKIGDFAGAKREIDVALELDPKYVKAWARKGDIEFYMKEYYKAKESYQKGLELDHDNSACKDGLRKVIEKISYGRRNMTEAEKKEQAAHAMADPAIQSIITDPVIQQVLRDFQENPNAAQEAMQNAGVRQKIQKLIEAGIIETA